jgi:hypothetical protein
MVRGLLTISATIAVLSVALQGGAALADQDALNARLHGDYAFTQSRDCIHTSEGFASDFSLLPIPIGGFINRTVNVDRGISHYNGDGTGTQTGVSTGIDINVFPPGNPVSQGPFTCDVTYTVHPDGSVDHNVTCSTTTTAGTSTVTGLRTQRQIVEGNKALLHAPAEPPAVETSTFTPLAGMPSTNFRICTRSGISIKIDH